MSRVLVCGGRDYNSSAILFATLRDLHALRPFSVVIEGEAPGADTLAAVWARDNGLPVMGYPADWNKHGKRAGYLRNVQMLDEGKPDLVIAFPGGRGTAMMVQLAKQRGVKVIEIVGEKESGV